MKVIVTDEISEKGLELLQKDPRGRPLSGQPSVRRAEGFARVGDGL